MDADVVEQVRRSVFDTFAVTGRAPTRPQLEAAVGLDAVGLDVALSELAAHRHVALDASGEIVMAHPFTSLNLGFSVMGRQTLWWGGCAWDSFAIPNLIEDEPNVVVATTCPACDRALAWAVTRQGPPQGDEVAHFLVPMDRVWDDVVFTCSNQRLFCSSECVDVWLARTGRSQGYLLDLETLWRLAHDWYTGRLDSPYQRRDPETAKQYFRSIGLHGRFWGLDEKRSGP